MLTLNLARVKIRIEINKEVTKMKIAKFEKKPNGKSFEIEVFVEDAKISLEINGTKFVAKATKYPQHGWVYEIYDTDLAKLVLGRGNKICFVHESAKMAFEEEKRQLEEKRAEEEKKLDEEFQLLSDDTIVKLSWGTSHQHAWVPDSNVGKHRFFKEAIELMKRAKFSSEKIEEVLSRKADDVDWGDYSITYDFNLTFGELKKLVKTAKKELVKIEKEKEEKEVARKAELEKKFEEAKRTGQKVEIRRWTTDCNNPNEECDLDVIVEYAMPDGSTKTERYHTW